MNDLPSELDPADQHQLNAAEGWLGLGNWREAVQELEQISPGARRHPQVLKVQYLVFAEAERWPECAEIGEVLVNLQPEDSFGWINRSYALRRKPGGGVQTAYDALRPAAEQTENLEPVAFNLACYCCQLDRLEEARGWLKKCFEQANSHGRLQQQVRQALEEPDLAPLWQEIRGRVG